MDKTKIVIRFWTNKKKNWTTKTFEDDTHVTEVEQGFAGTALYTSPKKKPVNVQSTNEDVQMEDVSPKVWNCTVCTLENPVGIFECQACGMRKKNK